MILLRDSGRGANEVRNRGWKLVNTPYTLFSDYDIIWVPGSLECLIDTLKINPGAAYAYGSYGYTNKSRKRIVGDQEWSAESLLLGNYISTMTLVRTKLFCGFDESIEKYQDWDAWLTMLEHGYTGIYCKMMIFRTPWVRRRLHLTKYRDLIINKHEAKLGMRRLHSTRLY